MSDDERKLSLERLKVRAEMRSAGEDELSDVIDREARARSLSPKSASTPAPARGLVAILNTLPPWGRVIVLVMLGALAGSGAFTALAEKFGWFR